ncbi:MAG TPA: hypothetical protein VN843_05020, partial [Anaerolineales bacterium]|nr:hypothetical protein [Anaerolineales bacterium]
MRRVRPSGERVIAATVESYAELVKYYCGAEPPAAKILGFNGIFEIIYALLQLNDRRRGKSRVTFDVKAGVERQGFGVDAAPEIEDV